MTWTSHDKCLVPGLGGWSSSLSDRLASEGRKVWAAGEQVTEEAGRIRGEGGAKTAELVERTIYV